MTERELDALTARVLATPDGRRWLDQLQHQDIGLSCAIANWKIRIQRERERWRTGALTPS